jgi:TPR repeat protein
MLFTTSVVAGDFENAYAAYKAGDYQKAFQLWKPLAEQGDKFAQAMVGFIYAQGLSVPKDKLKSIHWNTKAAEQGHDIAQHNLALTYADAKDYTKPVYWARKAAEQGFARSQGLLVFSYQEGEGVPQNDVKAAYWFRKVAEQGNVPVQHKVGHYYYLGKGTLRTI